MKILIGSSIYQKLEILKEFLISLEELNKSSLDVEYLFIDDNKDYDSSNELLKFKENNKNVTIYEGNKKTKDYICDEYSHYWDNNIVEKVTMYKNFIISKAIEGNYDYLFFIDSDIILHKNTLIRLVSRNKKVISNIFWTKWNPQGEEMPQVWLEDSYSFHTTYGKDPLDSIEMETEKLKFFDMLRNPGTYKVGGLGACTLIAKEVLERGVNFSRLYNLSFWGEDRHFSMRAVANGFDLYVDTYYPAYHIYRYEYLNGVSEYKEASKTRDIDIMGIQLFNLAREGIKRLKTYDDKGRDESYKLFFTEDGLNKIEDIEDGRTNSCEVLDCKMNFSNDLLSIKGTIDYLERGYKDDYSFYKEMTGEIEIIKVSNGMWRINSFEDGVENIVEDMPLLRRASKKPKLTLSMVVKNEGKRYLREVLESAREYVDEVVIIDDGSTDNTIEIIKDTLKDVKLTLIQNKESLFSTEWKLRSMQWEETIKTNPEWILLLDADEIFEDVFKEKIRELIANRNIDSYSFRLYDMWSKDYYRADKYWYAHRTYRTFLIRYQPNFEYTFKEKDQHSGRCPSNSNRLLIKRSELRLKHYGWSKEEDRMEKYKRYIALDKEAKYGVMEQYESILDEYPKLEKWIE